MNHGYAPNATRNDSRQKYIGITDTTPHTPTNMQTDQASIHRGQHHHQDNGGGVNRIGRDDTAKTHGLHEAHDGPRGMRIEVDASAKDSSGYPPLCSAS